MYKTTTRVTIKQVRDQMYSQYLVTHFKQIFGKNDKSRQTQNAVFFKLLRSFWHGDGMGSGCCFVVDLGSFDPQYKCEWEND